MRLTRTLSQELRPLLPRSRSQQVIDPSWCVLTGLPASFLPTDVHRFVSSKLLPSDQASSLLQQVIYLPDLAVPWTIQANILRLSSPASVQRMRDDLRKNADAVMGSSSTSSSILKVEEIRKHRTAQKYLAALEQHDERAGHAGGRLATNPRPHPVLLAGLPANTDPVQLENTLVNHGYPLLRAAGLRPVERASAGLYWPLIDPSPQCISNAVFALASRDRSKPRGGGNTRCQVLYAPSVPIANYMVAELNHAVPAWLTSRLNIRPGPDHHPHHRQSPGWKLMAKVVH
ncbi:hypothetical protein PCASD_26274 [Puccinia coronata f. sp. avenae]|uniref:Uncharacterized protein n=1 Tax=Puccinia coronata f. sp. avenae TaxID=200324 RepID=A0A2N5TH64_9BASI|nr:hypothetical protein PCASD_26668 [Puccinia coronata f. sp. avenae]PLW24833.1 hypothetical protein PCASD_26274 [Puccinia coronata f. sp. avenae]